MRSLSTETRGLLDQLDGSDETEAIDIALARMLAEHDPEHARAVTLGAALVSLGRRSGHSTVVLSEFGGQTVPGTSVRLPDAGAWAEALAASPVVGGPDGEVRPLVLEDGRLSLYRLWAAERRVAEALRSRLGAAEVDADGLRPTVAALFPDAGTGDRQALAAVGALRHRLAVVAGGPGTGKTTTVAKILALLLTAEPGLSVALAAPTGKASDRLGSSVSQRVAGLPVADGVKGRIPTEAVTLHRLLKYSPSRRRFMRSAEDPVPADVVVVDETSMVDLALFDALLAALRPDARLVLLGDADQLPSVGAGAVFGDLCAAGAGDAVSPGFAAVCAGLGVEAGEVGDVGPLADAVVRLTVSHRFSEGSGIGALARALLRDDADAVRRVLTSDDVPDVAVRSGPVGPAVWAHVEPHARRLCGATDKRGALDAVAAFRVLAPTRGGAGGVRALTAAVERGLAEAGLRPAFGDRWYHGRPVLVTTNDYDRDLYNGDVGVVWRRGGAPVVLFEPARGDAEAGAVREVPVGGLPEHETAWALTVHKAQGSEFGDVLFVLPAPPERERLTRALAYTAVTRSTEQTPGGPPPLTVLGAPDVLAQAAGRTERRATGLTARLTEA